MKNLIVGTAKSLKEDVYYKRSSVFWPLINKYFAGNTSPYQAETYRNFLKDHSYIGFADLAMSARFSSSKIEDLEESYHQIKREIIKFFELIHREKPKRIALNGLVAAGRFYQFVEGEEVSKTKAARKYYNRRMKGKERFGFIEKYGNIDIYVLPNTSNQAKRYFNDGYWCNFYEVIKKDSR